MDPDLTISQVSCVLIVDIGSAKIRNIENSIKKNGRPSRDGRRQTGLGVIVTLYFFYKDNNSLYHQPYPPL